MLRVLIFAICCYVPALSFETSQLQSVSPGQPNAGLATLPEKELFKLAEKSYAIGDWEKAFQALKVAFAKRNGKDHKKYSPMLAEVSVRLANGEAAKGQDALSHGALDVCEGHLQRAKGYAATPNVESLEKQFSTRRSELQNQFVKAKALANANEFEPALQILDSLQPYEKYVPEVKPEISRIKHSQIDYLTGKGWDMCAGRQWRAAVDFFQKALLKDPANERAKSGLARVDRGMQADLLAAKATEQMGKGLFREAMRSIDSAIQTDSDSKGVLLPKKNQIAAGWTRNLEENIPPLLAETRDFFKSRDAYNSLEALRDLQVDNPLVVDKLVTTSGAYGNNAWELADQLSQREDMSRITTAYTLLLSARERLPKDTIRLEQLKKLASGFNRKRAAQVIVSVENLCGASEKFVDAIRSRATSTVEKLGLPDLRVRTLQEYTAAPDEDTQFQELRPDGKSYTALLIIEVQRYQSDRTHQDISAKSEYTERMEEIPNPEYDKRKKEVDRETEEIQSGRRKIPEKQRQFYIQRLERDLERIPKMITRPLTKPYEYRVVEYTQTTEVRLVMRLKDRLTNMFISNAEEIKGSKSDNGREISGVHQMDRNGLQNQPLRMADREEALNQTEREVNEELGQKLPNLLAPFAQRFLREGKSKLDQKQTDEAVEYLLCHWAFVRGQLGEADTLLIRDLVKQETGFDLNRNGQEFFSLVSPVHTAR